MNELQVITQDHLNMIYELCFKQPSHNSIHFQILRLWEYHGGNCDWLVEEIWAMDRIDFRTNGPCSTHTHMMNNERFIRALEYHLKIVGDY